MIYTIYIILYIWVADNKKYSKSETSVNSNMFSNKQDCIASKLSQPETVTQECRRYYILRKIPKKIIFKMFLKEENMYEHLAIMFPENCRGHLGAVHYAGQVQHRPETFYLLFQNQIPGALKFCKLYFMLLKKYFSTPPTGHIIRVRSAKLLSTQKIFTNRISI